MKQKENIFSKTAFLSVSLLFIITGFLTLSYKQNKTGKMTSQPADMDNFKEISDTQDKTAPDSTRLHTYEGFNNAQTYQTDDKTDNTNKTDTSLKQAAVNEEAVPALASSKENSNESNVSANEAGPGINYSIYSNIGISIADSYVNIREDASTDSSIKGKLYKNSAAKILDSVGDWYYIESGNVKAYVKSEYLKTGIPDKELIENYATVRITVNTDGLNVRKNPETGSEKVTVIYRGESYPVISLMDEWVKIEIPDEKITGYVSREYVELHIDFNEAISLEEERELKKSQKNEITQKETGIKYRDAFDYTDEELKLLACLVHAEAGNQSYEGKLAVANVVLNRVKSGKFPDTIKDVIYQPGQFTVVKNGALSKQLKKYDSYSSKAQLQSIEAAKAALAGENNIGNRLYFNEYKASVKKGYDKKKNCIKIGDHLFW